MSKTIQEKHTSLINEIYRSFDFFNDYFCEGKLPKPILTIQGEKRKGKTYGWFGKEFWTEHNEDKSSNKIHEINLTAEALFREPKQVLETLLHEMTHLKNANEDIFDCNAVQHHNKHFKKTAEFFGLQVSKMKGRGWAKTELGQKASDVIELLTPKVELYKIVRTPPSRSIPVNKVINLSVSLDYEDKISYLTQKYGKKRELTEAAIDKLYNIEMNKDLVYGSKPNKELIEQ